MAQLTRNFLGYAPKHLGNVWTREISKQMIQGKNKKTNNQKTTLSKMYSHSLEKIESFSKTCKCALNLAI